MGRRSVTLAPLAEEGLSRPRLPHHHGPLPGRSKCAAERQARAPCSCFSLKTKALRSAGGQPTGSLRAVPRAGRASEHQGLQVGLSWEVPSWEVPPSVMKAAPLAAPESPESLWEEEAVPKAKQESRAARPSLALELGEG